MADKSRICSIWLGSETGILKGVSLDKKQAFNFCEMSSLSRDQEVCQLCWSDATETEVLVASVNGTVKTFSTEKGIFTETRHCGDANQGKFTGLAVAGSGLVTCVESGQLRVWKEESSAHVLEIDAGNSVCRMRQSPAQTHRVATGGKENGVKIWDLERPEKPVFAAKNVRNDWLDLRQPEWVRDMAFIPDSDKIVTCTGYHQVRVYDPASPQRRPVMEAHYGEYPLTAMSLPSGGTAVVVGSTQGHLAVLDLRKGLRVRGALKGLAGGVRGLQCHPTLPLVASCGLDRFLRVHGLEEGRARRTPLHKVYLKSRLNCLLMPSRGDLGGGGGTEVEEVKEEEEEEEEEDEVWGAMERVEEKMKRKARGGEEEEGREKVVVEKMKRKAMEEVVVVEEKRKVVEEKRKAMRKRKVIEQVVEEKREVVVEVEKRKVIEEEQEVVVEVEKRKVIEEEEEVVVEKRKVIEEEEVVVEKRKVIEEEEVVMATTTDKKKSKKRRRKEQK